MEGPQLAKIKEYIISLHSSLEEQNQFETYQIDDSTLSELEQQVDLVDTSTLKKRSQPIILDSPNPESETPRENKRSNTKEAAIDLEEEEDVGIDRQEGTNINRPTTVNIDRQTGNNVDRRSTSAEPAIERVYRTLPPFPPNKTQTKQKLDKAICKKAFD
ncbi:hypothetical protein F2Q69_00012643 [Brassica cretica]|uniref:Uncharacterized protein n=1 Tax=Brassica cretica TaxID=69181 RepID=A0A8S9R5S5_BRACR|nr:hypothetical protein F2Q69_00012643 [Brassica cretica]